MQTGLMGHHVLRYQWCEMRQRKMHALGINLTDQISANCRINQMSTNKNSYVALWRRGHVSKDWKELEGSGPLVEVCCCEPFSRQVGHTAAHTHTTHSTTTSLIDLWGGNKLFKLPTCFQHWSEYMYRSSCEAWQLVLKQMKLYCIFYFTKNNNRYWWSTF